MPNVKGGQRRPTLSLPWASIALASVATAFIPARSQAAQATLAVRSRCKPAPSS